MRFYSLFYKGFTMQQTEDGWYIRNFPDWCSFGPIKHGPYPTSQIAQIQIDRLLNA
jgi:hypothetical protein